MDTEPLTSSETESPRRYSFGLRTKVILGIMVIMVPIITGMTFVLLEKGRRDILDQMVIRGRVLSQGIYEYIVRLFNDDPEKFALGNFRVSELQDYIQSLGKSIGQTEIAVFDLESRIMAHKNPIMVGNFVYDTDVKKALQTNEPKFRLGRPVADTPTENDGDIFPQKLTVTSPITLGERLVGVIQVKFDVGELDNYFAFSRKRTIQLILIECTVLIIFVSLLLSILILRPIARMVEITHRIAKGELDQRVAYYTNDEIGQLAAAYNDMSSQLKESIHQQDETIISLEMACDQLQKTQDELVSSAKQASIGRLAAGVAHEIGNPLSSILGYTDILMMGVDNPKETEEYLQYIQSEVNRIQRIIRELLDYSRPSSLHLTATDINEVLHRTTRLLSAHKLFHDIDFKMNLDNEMPQIIVDENLMQQVFTNILMNAAQAMNGHGCITLETECEENEASIRISDNGPGIPVEIRERIFDPFFTTKDVGHGTGLGLSVSKTIVEKLGGEIYVGSNSGSGATFVIRFEEKTEKEEV